MKPTSVTTLRNAAFASAICLLTSAAQAATFDFSYTFANGGFVHQVSGQVEGSYNDAGTPGDTTDDYVGTPSVLSAAFDGNPFVSPTLGLYFYNEAMPPGFVATPTDMYVNASSNNFILSHCGGEACFIDAYNDPNLTIDYFLMRTVGQGGTGAQYYSEVGNYVLTDASSRAGLWSLTPAAAVPEPQAWALLLAGLALVGSAARRRERR